MRFQQKMGHPLSWRTPTDIHDVFGVDHGLLYSQPAQLQRELRPFQTKLGVRLEIACVEPALRERKHRKDRPIQKCDRKADEVSRKGDIDHLTLAIAQQLVPNRVAIRDEAKLLVFISLGDELAPSPNDNLRLQNLAEGVNI